jgi:hypothetical protein
MATELADRNAELCWICGDVGTSREHIAKQTDLRAIFPGVSDKRPLYYNEIASPDKDKRLVKGLHIKGYNNDRLKFKKPICARCNNQVTQPHDKAWERVSGILRDQVESKRHQQVIHFNRHFHEVTKATMTSMHLYFAKSMGCVLSSETDLSTKELAGAILNNRPSPFLGLQFHELSDADEPEIIFDHLHTGEASRFFWSNRSIVLGKIMVTMVYNQAVPPLVRPRGLWHPAHHSYFRLPVMARSRMPRSWGRTCNPFQKCAVF